MPLLEAKPFETYPSEIEQAFLARSQELFDEARDIAEGLLSITKESPVQKSKSAVYQTEGQNEGTSTRAWLKSDSFYIYLFTDEIAEDGEYIEDSQINQIGFHLKKDAIHTSYYSRATPSERLEIAGAILATVKLIEEANQA